MLLLEFKMCPSCYCSYFACCIREWKTLLSSSSSLELLKKIVWQRNHGNNFYKMQIAVLETEGTGSRNKNEFMMDSRLYCPDCATRYMSVLVAWAISMHIKTWKYAERTRLLTCYTQKRKINHFWAFLPESLCNKTPLELSCLHWCMLPPSCMKVLAIQQVRHPYLMELRSLGLINRYQFVPCNWTCPSCKMNAMKHRW